MKKFILFCLFAGLCVVAYPQCTKSRTSCYSSCSKKKQSQKDQRTSRDRDKRNDRKYQSKKRSKKKYFRERFTFSIGPGANYSMEPALEPGSVKGGGTTGTEKGFQTSLINFQANAMVGYKFDRRSRKPNMVGVWSTFGFHNPEAITRILNRQEVDVTLGDEAQNEFFEVEAGILFKEIFRLSAGIGYQGFTPENESSQSLQYYTVTTGVNIPITKWLSWQAQTSMLHGGDYDRFSFRPSTSLTVNFPFGRF